MADGIVSDIQRSSFHDGKGIRTTVFLKGCPLCCQWCHNPECISFEPQVLTYPQKCIGCGMCDAGCFSGARVECGRKMTAEDVVAEVLEDEVYYAKGGGVTLSGGEPMAQKAFAGEIIRLCRKNGISCAMETSLIYFDKDIFRELDFVMADFKIWDSDIHGKYTGVPNEEIKKNFRKLNELNVPIIARTPIIPNVNQEVNKISEFLKELVNVTQYDLLPYHPLGIAKGQALGVKIKEFEVPSKDYMKELEQYAYIR